MVGGKIIENINEILEGGQCVRRLWVVDTHHLFDECAVYAESAADCLEIGEEIWWQGGKIFARQDKLVFEKIAYSFDPQEDVVS